MKKDLEMSRPSGSKRMSEPRVIGDIINEMLLSNEPLAIALRKWIAEREASKQTEEQNKTGQLFKDFFPHTELGIDLKLITRQPGRMPVGAFLDGMITHDDEYHFIFIQNAFKKKKVVVTQRNPHVDVGHFINVNRKDDGTLYPTFNRPRFTDDFTFQDFCRKASEELLVVAGLLERKRTKC